jgi:isopenicillin N synthase-like dioxygenase
MFTFLVTDGTPGLQVWREGGREGGGGWRDVPAVEGAFIVNLGDMLQRWTNDVFRSTRHRVVIQERGREGGAEGGRYSAPFFYEPNFDTIVECLPGFEGEGGKRRYAPVKSGEYLLGKYRETHKEFMGEEGEEGEEEEEEKGGGGEGGEQGQGK